MFVGMNRAYPFIPTPVVPPLYESHNSASSGSNRSSPPHPESARISQTSRKQHESSSVTALNHTSQKLAIYSQQNEKLPRILKNSGRYSNLRHERRLSDFNAGKGYSDMNVTCEEKGGYERGNVTGSQYQFYQGPDSVEDEFQPNIPGTVIENCNHSTQIFVKVRSTLLS
jgi:hypothetical protein